jgi:hypothetical protein
MEWGKIPRTIYFKPAMVMLSMVVIALSVRRLPALSAMVVVTGVVVAFRVFRLDMKERAEEGVKVLAQHEARAGAPDEGALNRVMAETGQADELTMNLRSIVKSGERLLHYDAEGDLLVAELLKVYRGSVQDYLDGAADFAKKYRRARAFIKTSDPNQLALEVRTLEKRAADGEKGLDKLLGQKKSTLNRLEAMVANQSVLRNSIATIQATIESLDASIAEVEADQSRQAEIMDRIQMTLSSTASAIEKTRALLTVANGP